MNLKMVKKDKEWIRDRIEELKFERNKKKDSRQSWVIVLVALFSLVYLVYFYYVDKGVEGLNERIISSVILLILFFIICLIFRMSFEEDPEIKKEYNKLLGREK